MRGLYGPMPRTRVCNPRAGTPGSHVGYINQGFLGPGIYILKNKLHGENNIKITYFALLEITLNPPGPKPTKVGTG